MSGWLKIELIEVLTRGLHGAEERQKAIAHNLANLNTPGYKRWEVHFDNAIQAVLSGTASEDEDPVDSDPIWTRNLKTAGRPDGNNVDLETELALMNDNGLYQQTLARLFAGKLQRLHTAIARGGE